MTNYFSNTDLLKAPVKRSAYSDRTAYLMAEMSRLAYFKFEGGNNLDDMLAAAREFIPEEEKFSKLEHLIKNSLVNNSADEAESILKGILEEKGFELVNTFNCPETDAQAFLCRQPVQKMAILVFRGTEPKLKDIKTDVNATLKTVEYSKGAVRIHQGYYAQYESLQDEISESLKCEALQDHQLYITGHSLGGALAITAIKFLSSDSTGACYTFGSPPVGTKEFDRDIKTPIYRIVNHVDIVPRLPNPILVYFVRLLGFVFELVLSPLGKLYGRLTSASWYLKLEQFLVDANQYRQSGYGSYLVGSAKNPRLRYSVGIFDQIVWWLKQWKNLFRGETEIMSDHSIDLYAVMLRNWAELRTQGNSTQANDS